MEHASRFDLDQKLKEWELGLRNSSMLTPEDMMELKSHLLDTYESLTESSLSNEEAFLVAVSRVGSPMDWDEEFKKVNHIWLNTRKIVLIVAGVALYHLSYFFILFFAKCSIIVGRMLGFDYYQLLKMNRTIFLISLFTVLWGGLAVSIKNRKLFQLLQGIKFKLKHVFWIFSGTLIFAMLDRLILPLFNKVISDKIQSYKFFEMFAFFDYAYPLIMLIILVIIYLTTNKTQKFSD